MSLLREAWTGNYVPHGDVNEARAIIALAFGRGDGTPGMSNEALADFAILQSDQLGIHVIAQLAVADAISSRGRGDVLTRIDPRNNNEAYYMHTNHVLGRAAELIDDNKPVMLVAHAFHMPRADREAQRMGLKTIVPQGLPAVWDKDAIFQEMHCRTPAIWRVREPFIIGMNKLLGRI